MTRLVDPEGDVAAAHRRAAAGDRQAFEAVVRSFWEPVMRFFWKRIDRAEAEDLAQQVFISALRAAQAGGGPKGGDRVEWRKFLMASARNRLISHWRRMGVRPPAAGLSELIGDEACSPQDAGALEPLMRREVSLAIAECLGGLEPVARTTCWLVYVEGRSKRQTARILGRPEASVRTTITAALTMLRRCLRDRGVETG
jgi:RNA polymerase sigma factor (sigma-70 family)